MDTPARTPADRTARRDRPSPARVALAVGALLAVLGLGFVAFGRFVDDFTVSLVLQGVWFALVAGGALLLTGREPAIRRVLAATLAACAAVGAFTFYWTTVRDETVEETVATGVKASEAQAGLPAADGTAVAPSVAPEPRPKVNVERASGSFTSLAHQTTGTAAVIDLASGGRRVTLTDLETDNGPDLLVYLVPGPSNTDGSVEGGTSLGRLKGNVGTQQYEVPDGFSLSDGAAVVIWCRAFTVAFGVAQLEAS